jgi:hypothetical protein
MKRGIQYCAEVLKLQEARSNNGNTVAESLATAGPFANYDNSNQQCQLRYVDRGTYQAILSNEACTGTDMIAFKNTKYATGPETETRVEIFDANESMQCMNNYGKRRGDFEFWPDQTQNFDITEIQDDKARFCIKVTKGNDQDMYHGPFQAQPGCKIEVASLNYVSETGCAVKD